MDGVSWRILLADLERAYHGETLEPVGTSFTHWTRSLTDHVRADALDGELDYWKAAFEGADVPADRPGDNTAASARTLSVSLGREETSALLQDVPGAYRTEVNDVLLSALSR